MPKMSLKEVSLRISTSVPAAREAAGVWVAAARRVSEFSVLLTTPNQSPALPGEAEASLVSTRMY